MDASEIDRRLREYSNRIDTLSSKFTLVNNALDVERIHSEALKHVDQLDRLITQLETIPSLCKSENNNETTVSQTKIIKSNAGLLPESDSDEFDLGQEELELKTTDPQGDFVCGTDSENEDLSVTMVPQVTVGRDKPQESLTGVKAEPQTAAVEDVGDESDVTEDYDTEERTKDTTVDQDAGMIDFKTDDFDDDFDEEVLQQIDEAEKSISQDPGREEPEGEDDSSQQPADRKYLDVLKKYFGYGKFRPLQWKIINSVLNEKKDNLVIMATGYGKSLTYQFPSIYTGRTSIVVSPLISLMEDQVTALSTVNVKACFLGSAQQEMASVRRALMRGEYRLVYMTPEFLVVAHDLLQELATNVGLDLIAIDEAHCVSQWGHDFRSSYRQVGQIRKTLPKVPIMGLTATATPEVRTDIVKSLSLKAPTITCSSFDRPNLYLSVSMKSEISSDLRKQMMRVGQNYTFEGPTIIYCPTKKAAENVHNMAKVIGVKSALYHAGLSMAVRKKAHRDFINDDVQVVVATVAFGMGIDKPDVRTVIHYGAPKDIESYYQEMGRAGRDGKNSSCHVYYSTGDFNTNRFFLQDIKSPKFLEHKKDMLVKMEAYFSTTKCRRRAILSHFENKDVTDVGGTERCCDNCTRRLAAVNLHGGEVAPSVDQEKNMGREAVDLLDAIEITGCRYGLGVPILFLTGSNSQKLPTYYQNHAKFGKAKYHNAKWWKAFARQIISEKYLTDKQIQGSFGSTVELTEKGSRWLRSVHNAKEPEMMLQPNMELQAEDRPKVTALAKPTFEKQLLPSVPTNSWLSSRETSTSSAGANKEPTNPRDQKLQAELYRKLIVLRNEVSQDMDLPPHMVFSNKCLLQMAQFRPSDHSKLVSLEEVAEEKATKYGGRFLAVIAEFCLDSDWSMDSMPKDVRTQVTKLSRTLEAALCSLPETFRQSYHFFELDKKSLEETAMTRALKTSTIITHLAKCISAGLPVDIERIGITQKIITMVTDAIRKPPINSDISRLTPIKEQLPDYIEFNHIKVVIAILQRKFGMNENNIDTIEPDTSTAESQGSSGLVKQQSLPLSGSLPSTNRPQLGRSQSAANTSRSVQSQQSRSSPWQQKSTPASPAVRSQSQNAPGDGGKRKLPSWMSSKEEKNKKMKKNNLFSR